MEKQGPPGIIATGSNRYVYDEQGRLIGEYDANQQVIEETVYLGDLPVAVLKQTTTGAGSSQSTTTHVYYVYADHLNTPRVITQASDNQMVWRWDHADPFGLFSPIDNPSGLGSFTYNQRFPGQLYDRETNNFYNYFRDYDPQQGRYLQSDPIGLQGGINTYTYVNGNPVSYTDPTGLCPWCVPGAAIGGAIGGGFNAYQQLNSGAPFNWTLFAINTAGGALAGMGGGAFAGVTTNIVANMAYGAASNMAIGTAMQISSNLASCQSPYEGTLSAGIRNGLFGAAGGLGGQLVSNIGPGLQQWSNRSAALGLAQGHYTPPTTNIVPVAGAAGTSIGNAIGNAGGFSNYPPEPSWWYKK